MKLNKDFILKLNKLFVEMMLYYKIYPECSMVHSGYYEELGTRLQVKYANFVRLKVFREKEMDLLKLSSDNVLQFNTLVKNFTNEIDSGRYGLLAPFFIVQTCIIYNRTEYLTEQHINDINDAIKSKREPLPF